MTVAPVIAFACGRPGTRYTLSGLGVKPSPPLPTKDLQLPKPNYAFQKRQRDLAKQRKKQEKKQKKAALKTATESPGQPAAPDSGKTEL